jgi:transglutaminase-like putative cysteine protease
MLMLGFLFMPEMGWCEFDPTNNIISGERHIVTAMGGLLDISTKGIILVQENIK